MSVGLKKRIALICLFCLITTPLCGGAVLSAEAAGTAQPWEGADLLPEPAEQACLVAAPALLGLLPGDDAVETAPVPPMEEEAPRDWKPEASVQVPLYVDGIRMGDGLLLGEETYVSAARFCGAMDRDIQVQWDPETETMTASLEREEGNLELCLRLGDGYLTANDRCFYAPGGVRLEGEEPMVPIRSIAAVFGAEVLWHEETRCVSVETAETALPLWGAEVYDEEALYWLSHIIHAESGNQPLEGMIGVGNVVLNRVQDPSCPDNVYDVIFDRRYGVQFSPTETGSIYDEPGELAVAAAKMCLEGSNVVEDSLFFLNPAIGVGEWFRRTRTYVTTIGEHVFYA